MKDKKYRHIKRYVNKIYDGYNGTEAVYSNRIGYSMYSKTYSTTFHIDFIECNGNFYSVISKNNELSYTSKQSIHPDSLKTIKDFYNLASTNTRKSTKENVKKYIIEMLNVYDDFDAKFAAGEDQILYQLFRHFNAVFKTFKVENKKRDKERIILITNLLTTLFTDPLFYTFIINGKFHRIVNVESQEIREINKYLTVQNQIYFRFKDRIEFHRDLLRYRLLIKKFKNETNLKIEMKEEK